MNVTYKICFVCTGNACRSPFAECVTKKLLADAGMKGIEVFSLGTLDWGENPRDAVIVFDERHRDAITRVLDYGHWNRIVLFNKIALNEDGNVEDPHYQTAAVYRRVAKHIENGCKQLVETWIQKPPETEG